MAVILCAPFACAPAETSAPTLVAKKNVEPNVNAPAPVDAGPPVAHAKVHGLVPRVGFDGNQSITSDELLALMRVDEFFKLDDMRSQLDRDGLAIQEAYWNDGYVDAKIGEPKTNVSSDGRFFDVQFGIEEGPRYQIHALTIFELDEKGRPRTALGKKSPRAFFPADGAMYQQEAIVQALTELQRIYRDAGYGLVEVTLESNRDAPRAAIDIAITIHRGPVVHLSRVVILGVESIPMKAIQKAITVHAGDLYSETKILQSKEKLLKMAAVRDVNCSTAHEKEKSREAITFEITEEKAGDEAAASGKDLLKYAESLRQLNRPAEARAVFMGIVHDYPFSKIAKQARAEVGEIDAALTP